MENNVDLKLINSPVGMLLVGLKNEKLALLEFVEDNPNKVELEQFATNLLEINCQFKPNIYFKDLEKELEAYFNGTLKNFTIECEFFGTDFQKTVWEQLTKIPYGQTISYKQQAERMNGPKKFRAVAGANSKNKIAIIVPCHRVIGSNKSLTGYAGGIWRKKALLDIEKALYEE